MISVQSSKKDDARQIDMFNSDIDASIIPVSLVAAQETNRWATIIAWLYLIVMCVQYVPLEGHGVSPIKVSLMCISVVFLLLFTPSFSRAMLWGGLYLLWIFADMFCRFDNPRLETMGYSVMFFVTYMLFYELVYNKKAFTTDSFIRLMKILLWSYIIVLIVQQIFSLAGMRSVPLLNMDVNSKFALKVQSLSLEPSHSARIIGAAFFAFMKVHEYKGGTRTSLKWLWQNERNLLIGFIYAMLSMQSGTAIFVLLILCLYFFHWKYFVVFILFIWMIPTIQSLTESEQLERVIKVLDAVMTGEVDEVIAADHSASYRILPVLNLVNLDFLDPNTWLGNGTDTAIDNLVGASSARDVITGGIQDYGLIAYTLSLLFVFQCCIRPLFSLTTLLFFLTLGGAINNIAYSWGILMIFTCQTFFFQQSILERNNDDEFTQQT